jgi:hypothetical protein
MAGSGNRGLVLALTGIALLLAAMLIAYRPPVPLGADASPGIFSAYRANAILRDLVGSGTPHPIGSLADVRMREAIVERLSAFGYATELQSGFVCNDGVCGRPVNIIARLRPAAEDQDAVLLAAHYDSVPAGPGASDDGAAVASIIEIARILAARPPPRHPIVLLLTDGEEAGLLGALLFVQRHPLSRQVKAAVNLDARGTSGPSLMFETGAANSWLMRLYAAAIARPFTNSLYYVVYKQLPNDTDFTVFKKSAYQGFNFAFIGNVGRYHTPLDSVANISASSIQHHGDNALAALWALANASSLRPPIAESVFFDAYARGLIAWPAAGTLPAALIVFALLLAEAFILLRRRIVSKREIMWGGAGVVGMLISGVALCAALVAVGLAVGKVPPFDGASWVSQPLPMNLAAASVALLAAGVAGAWLARRAGFWGFWLAAALFDATLSAVIAAVNPGASFVLLLTSAAAAIGALPFAADRLRSRDATARTLPRDDGSLPPPSSWTTDWAALLPALVIFALTLPLLRFLYTALGSLAWPVSTLVLCLGAASLLPLLAAASVRARRRVVAATGLTALGAASLALCLPTYSAEWPERINVEYWLNADTGQSQYLARCDSLRLPAALGAAAHFDPEPRPRFAGAESLAFFAPAPKLVLAAPELSPVSASAAVSHTPGGATHFLLRLRSLRGAPEALVVFPSAAQINEVELLAEEGPLRAKLGKLKSGATILDIVGLPAEGVEFGVDVAVRLPVAVQVFDENYDFPDALPHARPANATSSQDGDLTVVQRTVSLDPAAGRTDSSI